MDQAVKIDQFKCVIMSESFPGNIGDSCAETGRFVVLTQSAASTASLLIDLDAFITPSGFIRHPLAPQGWREDDFTSDQMTYLLMASWLVNRDIFNFVVNNLNLMTKYRTPDVRAIAKQSWNLLGVYTCLQVLINKVPWRWHDGENGTETWGWFRRKFWRFTSSNDSTVSYLTVFIAMVFLKRVGVTWPSKFFNFSLYLQKAKAYYSNQPDSKWFTDLFDGALS